MKRLAIATAAALLTPALAVAQPFTGVVFDSQGHEVGPLDSSDSIAQGVVIRIRTYDQTVCGGNDVDCEDQLYLLIPWTVEGPGYPARAQTMMNARRISLPLRY